MVHPALALYDSSFRKRVFASLVHFSMDVRLAREGETVVSLGLLFENSTGRALQDAEFILRLPEGATVNFMECEVERADRNIVLSASTESLCGKYGMNTSQEGPFFLCHIGRISANRDVVVFLK